MSEFDFDLSQYDDEYAAAPTENPNDPVPDGKYQAVVHKVELARSKQNDTPMLKWQLRIIAPHSVGRFIFRNNMLGNAENIKWLKQDLFTCGLELEKLSDLPNRLEDLLDVAIEVTVKTKGEYSNVFINRRLDADMEGGDPTAGMDPLLF